jgi:large subunit ribosomal protein L6
MSRIGQMPIPIPNGVTVAIDGNVVSATGPKGSLSQVVPKAMKVTQEDGVVNVTRPSEQKVHKSLHGLARTLIANMVHGVSEGYETTMEVRGVGYRAEMKGTTLVLSLGYSHPVEVEPMEGIEFAVEAGTLPGTTERYFAIFIRGCDKQVVGQQAAEIRKWRRPEPYKGKGIRYRGERVRKKAGKAGKAGA